MSEQSRKPAKLRRDFGEFLEAPKKDPNEKPRYYIKVTAKSEILDMIKEGTIIELEGPDEKYKRMLASNKLNDKQKADCEASLERIPKFFVKRLVAKI
jgi:hypothetical protein